MGPVDILWSPAAQEDLIEIWAYFAKLASSDIADFPLAEIGAAATIIATNPLAWRERTELARGIRAFPVHPYTVFYRVIDGVPEIVRVLHERRNSSDVIAE